MRSSSIVLLSGGLDSVAAFHWASKETDLVMGLTFDYGQRAAVREIEAAKAICAKYDIPHRLVELPWYQSLKSSSLLDDKLPIPTLNVADLDNASMTKQSAESVWIPNRNAVFIQVAASIAEHNMTNSLVVGFNVEEAQTFPDNSKEFLELSNKTLKLSTRTGVEVKAPMAGKTKKEIVQWAKTQKLEWTHLWSCYRGLDRMCGACESCQRLKRAFTQAHESEVLKKWF